MQGNSVNTLDTHQSLARQRGGHRAQGETNGTAAGFR